MTGDPAPAPVADLARLRSEVDEQPAAIARVLDRLRDSAGRLAAEVTRRAPRAVVLVARGSSDNAAVYGRYLFEVCNHQLTSLAAPSTVTLYGSGPRLDRAVVVGVSQSGRGEDVVAFLQAARADGALTAAVVNDVHSPLATSADWVLDCQAGPEVSVPATKTVTAQMAVLALLSASLAGPADVAALDALPDAVARALAQRDAVAALVRHLPPVGGGSVIGRGFAFPPALEVALKLKETCYTRAEPFSAADFVHGPMALVQSDYRVLVLDAGGRSTDAAVATARAVRERGGHVLLLRAGTLAPLPEDVAALPGVSLPVPVGEPHAPLVLVVLGQLLALELALARGLDPARPRGLRKVTSTR